MKPIPFAEVGKIIFEFEDQESENIADVKVFDKEAWTTVRLAIFYNLFFTSVKKRDTKFKSEDGITQLSKKYIKIAVLFGNFITFFFRYLFLLLTKKRNPLILFFARSTDKVFKDEKGKFVNVLLDEMIREIPSRSRLCIEVPYQEEYIQPAFIQKDMGTDGFRIPVKLLFKFVQRKYKNQSKAQKITDAFNSFMDKNYPQYEVKITVDLIKAKLDQYMAEYIFYYSLFFFLRPRKAILPDQTFSGLIGALKKLGTEVYDVQHGMMSAYYQHYAMSGKLKARKKDLVISDKILMFGDYHRKMMLRFGYWEDTDLISLGHFKLDYWRNQKPTEKDKTKIVILFPSQWHVFNEIKGLLEGLLELEDDIIINFKVHPSERKAQTFYYYELIKKYPKKIRIWSKFKDIYQLMEASDIVIGFESTTLMEAMALGKPTITFGTTVTKEGIHTYLDTSDLKSVIRIVYTLTDLINVITNMKNVPIYRRKWEEDAKDLGSFLYAENYSTNCKHLVKSFFKKSAK